MFRRTMWLIVVSGIVYLIFAIAGAQDTYAAENTTYTPRQTRIVREHRRIQSTINNLQRLIDNLNLTIDWLEDIGCGIGIISFCPVVEEEPMAKVSIIPWGPVNFEGAEVWEITRYYSPKLGQGKYLYEWKDPMLGVALFTDLESETFVQKQERLCKPGNTRWIGYSKRVKGAYGADACIQGAGDIFKTADGTDLRLTTPYRVAACPPELPFGTRIDIEGIGSVTCRDRGGLIKEKRLDIHVGIGREGLDNLQTGPQGGKRRIIIKL